MTTRLDDWAEDHGYRRGRCSECARTVWTDTGVFECPCQMKHQDNPADDEYACSQCHEVYAGTPPHETVSNEPLCCRCLSAETGEPCEHPLFTV